MRRIHLFICLVFECVINFYRIFNLKLKYSGLKITGKTKIAKDASIVCAISSKLLLNNAEISRGALIIANHGREVEIENIFIDQSSIIVGKEKLSVKSDCQIAEMVAICNQDHRFDDMNSLIKNQGFKIAPIVKSVWIGSKATILKGVTIGKNSVIAAHALVNNNLDSNSLYGGIPAEKIKPI